MPGSTTNSDVSRASLWFGVLFLLLTAAAGAFYGGIRYQQNKTPAVAALSNIPSVATATPTPTNELSIFDTYTRLKATVDSSPNDEAQRMASENGGKPLESTDPIFLSLYGRALFLSGKHTEAVEALKLANDKFDGLHPPGRNPIRLDTRLTLAAAAMRANNADAMRLASESFGSVIEEQGIGVNPPGGTLMPSP